MRRHLSAIPLAVGLLACLAPPGSAQQRVGVPSYMSLYPGLPSSMQSGSLLSGIGDAGGAPLPDMNVLFEPVVDSLYLLGTGDILTLGMGSRTTTLAVNPEGVVVLENIGPVAVVDMTLRDAKKLLVDRMSRAYKGDKLFVTLSLAKKVQASIVGAVANPGIFTVSAAARLSDLVLLAGGLAPNANRLITVLDRDGRALDYDLDKYYLRNDIGQNPYVLAGAQVKVEEVDYSLPTVEIRENDQVATAQLKAGMTVYDLIMAHNIFKKSRHWNRILVFEDGKQVRSLSLQEAKAHVPEPGCLLEVKSNKQLVFVSGAIARPSSYEFNSNFTALDYISSAGIMHTTGKFDRVRVIGADGSERFIDSSRDRVAPGDHIIVTESSESRIKDYVALFASVASIVLSATLTIVTINNK